MTEDRALEAAAQFEAYRNNSDSFLAIAKSVFNRKDESDPIFFDAINAAMNAVQHHKDGEITDRELYQSFLVLHEYLDEQGEQEWDATLSDIRLEASAKYPELSERKRTLLKSVKCAKDVESEPVKWLWYPYIPLEKLTVLAASGGSGKSTFATLIAYYLAHGLHFPDAAERGDEMEQQPRKRTLFISAEETAGEIKHRLELCGANSEDSEFIYILDSSATIDAEDGKIRQHTMTDFEEVIEDLKPALVILDPWHAFLGSTVDINRANEVRPIFQQMQEVARKNNCAIMELSHVNKKAQDGNANFGALGSVDLTNTARSVLQFTREDGEIVVVHTKTNNSAFGRSLRFTVDSGKVRFTGFSDITRDTLEQAARCRSTPEAVAKNKSNDDEAAEALIRFLTEKLRAAYSENNQNFVRVGYSEIRSGGALLSECGKYEVSRYLEKLNKAGIDIDFVTDPKIKAYGSDNKYERGIVASASVSLTATFASF